MKLKKLLSVFIALALLLSLISVPVFADGNNVAQIGNVGYETLVAAVEAANADTSSDAITITLCEDLDFSAEEYAGYKWAGSTYNPLTITRDNVTIDLAGHTISNMGNAAIAFGNLLAADGRIANATIQNGTLLAGKTDNVTNSYVLGIAGVDGALVKNVTTNGGINVYTGSKDVVIDSCNVNGTKYYTVCAQCGSDVTIKGTTYTKNTDSSVAAKAMFWVDGAGSDSDVRTPENPTGAYGASSIIIESGNFTVSFANGGVFKLGSGLKPVVKGGTFNFDPTDYLADGYEAVNNGNGTWTVKSAYAAQIGETKYETLDAAADAANPGDTIVLLDDITYGTDRVVPVWEKGFNIDLNGYTLTTNSNQSITLSNNGYKATAICFGIDAPHGDSYVTNGTIRTAYGTGIYAAGDVTMTLSGLDVKQNYPTNVQTTDEYSSAIRLTSKSVVIVEDGSYSGKNAIAVSNSGGSVTVNGGNFTGDIFFSNSYSKGLTAADKVITINGGNFAGNFVNPNKGKLTIYGGTFNDEDVANYVADGYEAVNNGDGTWTVGEVKAGELTQTATQGDADATYTLTKQVVDENDNVIDEGTNRTVNVKVVSEDDTSVNTAEEIISNLSMDKVLDSVVAKIDDAVDTVKVEIQVASDDTNVDNVNHTITYEVHPEATIYVNDQPAGTVTISNDALAENAVFTIKLAVPNNIAEASANGNVTVTHISADYGTETAIYPLQGEENNYYVQFDVTHFSEFVVEAGGSLFTGHSVTLNGYINLNFYLNLAESQVTTGEGTVVDFTWGNGSASHTVALGDYVVGKGYKATVALPAAEMTYDITATVKINNDTQSETSTYSVRQYADDLLAITSDTKLINLVNAMLDYGAKAQIAFNSNVGDLANDGIAYTMPDVTREDLLNLIDQAIIAANNGARATVVRDVAEAIGAQAYYSSSLIYLSGCTLRHYFYSNNVLDSTKFTGVKSDYYYYIDKENIAAADLDKLQAFTVGDLTFHYSALDFVKAIIYNYTEGANYDLAAATYWYNQAANAYFE